MDGRRRTNPLPSDRRRLREGAAALSLGEPETEAEAREQLDILHCGIIALQSINDLGSDEANHAAEQDIQTLMAKRARLEAAFGR